ncbi:DUF1676 domain-containing protein Osi6 [Lycorma delicatula]|uniref:DUF1676 domain-containing protein Osi6 n=1 Tax=Lycorma delicatula TaxID=130591 RepID=UPI003F50E1C7
MKNVFLFLLLLATGFGEDKFKSCFEKDSISCVQIEMFRSMKYFFDQENLPIFGGLSLVKNQLSPEASTRSLSMDTMSENKIISAADVEKREEILESFTIDKIFNFFQERSLSWNLSPLMQEVGATARGLMENIPDDVKQKISELVTEGRGKKKKLMKLLLPLLIGLKLKMAVILVIGYFIIALIAKKAILASIISLAISGFIAIRKLLSNQHQHHPQVSVHPVEYSSHGGGWSSGGSSGWDSGHGDSHGSYSNNVAHSLAYSAQKPVR